MATIKLHVTSSFKQLSDNVCIFFTKIILTALQFCSSRTRAPDSVIFCLLSSNKAQRFKWHLLVFCLCCHESLGLQVLVERRSPALCHQSLGGGLDGGGARGPPGGARAGGEPGGGWATGGGAREGGMVRGPLDGGFVRGTESETRGRTSAVGGGGEGAE